MTAPSNANTSGLEVVAWRWPSAFLVDGMVCSTLKPKALGRDVELEPLVTAASAQERIAELEALVSKSCDLSVEQTDKLLAMHERATAAEARADRLAKALERIADRPGAGTTYTKGIGEQPVGEAEHMAEIARAAIQQEW